MIRTSFDQKKFDPKNFGSKNCVKKVFWSKKILNQKMFWPKQIKIPIKRMIAAIKNVAWMNVQNTFNLNLYENSGCTPNFSFIRCVEAHWCRGAGWVGGRLVKSDFRFHSGLSEPSLDSESKFEPSVAITCPWRSHILRLHSSAFMLFFEDLLTYIDTNSSSPNMFHCVAETKKLVLEIFCSLG